MKAAGVYIGLLSLFGLLCGHVLLTKHSSSFKGPEADDIQDALADHKTSFQAGIKELYHESELQLNRSSVALHKHKTTEMKRRSVEALSDRKFSVTSARFRSPSEGLSAGNDGREVLFVDSEGYSDDMKLPFTVDELLRYSSSLGFQVPDDPWMCANKPDMVGGGRPSPPRPIPPVNSSRVNAVARFRDSTIDLRDCALFVESLKVTSPYDNQMAPLKSGKLKTMDKPLKIAFLFLTRGPMPFSPLWQRFFKGKEGKYSIYVHTRPSFRFRNVHEPFFGRQIRSRMVYWGTISVIDAFKRLLASALLDPYNARFILVSERDIPIRNFSFIYRYLLKSKASFNGGPHKTIRETKIGLDYIGRPVMAKWRHGEAWSEFSRKHARMLVADWKYYEMGAIYCKKANSDACVLDENLLQTILYIKDPSHVANRTVMSTDWEAQGAHPKLYQDEEVTERLILGLQKEEVDTKHRNLQSGPTPCFHNHKKSVCWLFARKFSPASLKKIMAFPKSVLGY